MTIDLTKITRGKEPSPPRIVLYGTGKVGKSTFAAGAPNPIFFDIEGGIKNLDVSKERITTYAEFVEMLSALFEQDHKFETVVIDSADWLESLLFNEVCTLSGVKSIEEANGGWGKGYTAALNLWRELLEGLSQLVEQKGMGIIIICHDKVRPYNDPTTEAYDRYTLKLHDGKNSSAVDLVKEWADCILFAKEKTVVTSEGKGKKMGRKLYTTETPAFVAGNRYGLPEELPLSWDAFETAFKQSTNPTTGERND